MNQNLLSKFWIINGFVCLQLHSDSTVFKLVSTKKPWINAKNTSKLNVIQLYQIKFFENIGELCKGINDKGINLEKNSFKFEQYLSAPNLRFIERIHGKQGLVALDKLHNDPLLVLPAIFKCLKGKPQDITGKAYDYDKKWAWVNAENDQKSLR